MHRLYYMLFAFLCVGLFACKSIKPVANTQKESLQSIKKLNAQIAKNQLDFDYFNTKIRVNTGQQTFVANIQMKTDSIIWISLTGPLNIEGARIRIYNNTFEMVDRMNKTYYKMPLQFVENYIPIAIDFQLLENLILGNFLEKEIKNQKIETKEDTIYVKGDKALWNSRYGFLSNGLLQYIEIEDNIVKDKVKISHEKYEKIDNKLLSTKRKYFIEQNGKYFFVDLKFYKFDSNKTDYPFEIPEGFRMVKE
jgi:hypothetical protein